MRENTQEEGGGSGNIVAAAAAKVPDFVYRDPLQLALLYCLPAGQCFNIWNRENNTNNSNFFSFKV